MNEEIKEKIDITIRKVRVAMQKHREGFNDYDMLVCHELDYNEWKELLDYINNLQKLNGELRKEIERLNNIINELKNYTKAHIEVCENRLSTPFCNFEKATKELMIYNNYLDKLQKLKENKQ